MCGPAARVYLKIVRSTSRRKRLRTTRAYIRPRRPHHDSESRQDVRARLRRCPRRRGPGGIRRPRERCAGDDEVHADLLDPLSERAARKPQVRVLHPRARKRSGARADGFDGDGRCARGGADRDPRHGEHPEEPELPPGSRQLARTVQDVLQERDESGSRFGAGRRLARRPRDDGEDARSAVRALLSVRMAAGPRPLTYLISERPLELGAGGSSPEEAYLADGILALEMHPTSDLFVQRRLRVVKMRGTKHDTGYYAFSFEDGSFEVTRAVSGA